MIPDRKGLSEFFRINKAKFGKCLEPHMQCGQPVIRAHSIQNSQVIDLLADNNHVMAIRPRFSTSGPELEFQSIGRNEASTFTGFCNQHDTELFKPLDTKPLDTSDQEQLFLLAYRSISREVHATGEAVIKGQSMHISRIERGLDSADEASPGGLLAVNQMLLSWATWRYREKFFDRPLLSGGYNGIQHDVISLENQSPCLAVSSFFTFEDRDVRGDLAGVTLNVLPLSTNRTVAILSYADQDRGAVHASFDRILTATGGTQKYELSKLIISRMENFIIAPRHFNAWSAEKVQRIKTTFIETAITHGEVQEHQDLMLF